MVSVADNGGGIPDDLKPHLFDPFVTTKRNGTGLGLALVAKVIGDHGGVIEFDSQPRRTVFRVFLPVVTPAEVAQDGSRLMSATILVADDDRAIRMVLNQALARLGHDVRHDRQRGDAVALGRRRRGRPRHHRRDHAGRERARPDPAHQEAAARICASS